MCVIMWFFFFFFNHYLLNFYTYIYFYTHLILFLDQWFMNRFAFTSLSFMHKEGRDIEREGEIILHIFQFLTNFRIYDIIFYIRGESQCHNNICIILFCLQVERVEKIEPAILYKCKQENYHSEIFVLF